MCIYLIELHLTFLCKTLKINLVNELTRILSYADLVHELESLQELLFCLAGKAHYAVCRDRLEHTYIHTYILKGRP